MNTKRRKIENPTSKHLIKRLYASIFLEINQTISKYSKYKYEDAAKVITDILKKLKIEKDEISEVAKIEQRSKEWFEKRKYLLTASNFAACAVNNKYTTYKALLEKLITPSYYTNKAIQWGVDNEDNAAEAYTQYMKHQKKNECMSIFSLMKEKTKLPDQLCKKIIIMSGKAQFKVCLSGLNISSQYNYLGCSPDLLVVENGKRGGGEIKCPFGKMYDQTPPHYYDQIQGTMNLLQLEFYDFIVWKPDALEIKRYKPDTQYWEEYLFPHLTYFYFVKYIPRLIIDKFNLILSTENIDDLF